MGLICDTYIAHLNVNRLKLLIKKDMVISLKKTNELDLCEGCIYGKQTGNSFQVRKSWRATTCLELVHVDLYKAMKVESLGGSQYLFLFSDDYNHFS